MPGSMIHLAVAREYLALDRSKFDATTPDVGLFFFANIAPDYTDIREFKNIVHLRNSDDRLAALRLLRERISTANPFELGWLLHLFADYFWDNEVVPRYRDGYSGEGVWFTAYRAELGLLSYAMYRECAWAASVWESMNALTCLRQTSALTSVLPVPLELEWYRDRVRGRHERGGMRAPEYFTIEAAEEFAARTARRFCDFMES